jgi:rod shape-determining protein MreB and related proteins
VVSIVDLVDERAASRPAAVVEPAALGVDLGSAHTRIWASGRALLQASTVGGSLTHPTRPVQRGRITDPAALEAALQVLLRRFRRPVPAGATIVACHPVLADPDDQAALRDLLSNVFDRARVLPIATVRAAAIGSGAAPGPLLVADVGAQLTEVAVLADGTVRAARRADIGIRDLIGPRHLDPIIDTIAEFVGDLRREDLAAPTAGGLLLVGGGAAQPTLAARTAAKLDMPVRVATKPQLAAVHGAGLAALATLRRGAATAERDQPT